MKQTQSLPEKLSFQGSCFCGAATFQVEGKPLLTIYCHCTLCQRLGGAAFGHGLHYPTKSFTWTHEDRDVIFTKSRKESKWELWRCGRCYTFVGGRNSLEDKWTIKGSNLKRNSEGLIENWELIKPTGHVFYGTRMLDVNDDLPKWEGHEHESRQMKEGRME